MKKKFFLIFILWFLLLNSLYIYSYYFNTIWNNLFNKKSYELAKHNFQKSNNIYGILNQANSFYKEKNYEEAIKKYLSIYNDDKNILSFKINHNLWNSYYKYSEIIENNEEKIQYLQKTIEYYEKALNIIYDEETKKNLEFVLDKINNLEKEQWDESKSEKEQWDESQEQWDETKNEWNENWDEWQEQWDETKSEWNEKWDESQEQSDETKNEWNENWDENNLNPEQKQILENYQEALKQNQIQNSNYYNKVYQENNNDPFEDFFTDPFFNNDLLNWWNNKKDW